MIDRNTVALLARIDEKLTPIPPEKLRRFRRRIEDDFDGLCAEYGLTCTDTTRIREFLLVALEVKEEGRSLVTWTK